MIKIILSYNRETMNFIIKDKEIYYSDRKFKNWVRCMPPPENLAKIIAMSRNRIPVFLINMFHFTEDEIKEWNEAKDESAVADIVIKDAKSKGCILVSKLNEDGEK
jgi:hypothetical protein